MGTVWKDTHIVSSGTDLPVIARVAVLVVGAGAAGVAAAETAARFGHRTMLVEKYGFPGGAAVAGLSGTICGMFNTSEDPGKPEIIVAGFARTFLETLKARGGVTGAQRYGKTWTVTHDPHEWKRTAEHLLQAAGVELLYHSTIIGVVKDKGCFRGVVVYSRSGSGVILAERVIDASGDAQLAHLGGLDCTLGKDGRIQNPTTIFRISGVDVERYKAYWGSDTISPPKVIDMLVGKNAEAPGDFPRTKIWVFPTPRPNELMMNATRLVDEDGVEYNPLDPFRATQAELAGRRQVAAYTRFMVENIPGCEAAYVNDTGVEIGTRQTRSIVGMQRLGNDDVLNKVKRPDGIVRSSWPIELHAGSKPKVHWLLDDYYEVPFGTLVPASGENIIMAGRCLSAEHEALASARVTAQCFGYGQAAGIATDLSLRTGTAYRNIRGEEIRARMNADGAGLD